MTDPHLSAPELQRRALRGISWSTVSSILSMPLAIAVSVVLARTLGPSEFARFAYLSFLVPLLYQVTDLGFSQSVNRATSQAFAAGDFAQTKDLLRRSAGWNLLRLPLVAALFVAVARPDEPVSIALVTALALTMGTGGLVLSLAAENRGATAAKLAFVQGLAAAAASVVPALLGASGTTVWALSFASGALLAPAWLVVANPSLRSAALRPLLPRHLPAGFWRFGFAAIATTLGYTLVFSRSEIVILEFLEQEHALAVFALAYGLSQRLTTPVDTMLGPLVLAFSALEHAHPDRLQAGFERALRLSCAGVAFLGGAAVVGTALVAPVLFGSEYEGVGLAFAALAAASLVQSAAQPYPALASGIGRPAIALRALAVALVVDIAIAFALIPPLGLWGAVIANAAGAATAVGLSALAVAGRGSLSRAGVPVARLALVTTGSAALGCLVALPLVSVHPLLAAAAAYAVGTIAFVLGAGRVGGFLASRDAAILLESLPRRLVGGSRAPALIMRRLTYADHPATSR